VLRKVATTGLLSSAAARANPVPLPPPTPTQLPPQTTHTRLRLLTRAATTLLGRRRVPQSLDLVRDMVASKAEEEVVVVVVVVDTALKAARMRLVADTGVIDMEAAAAAEPQLGREAMEGWGPLTPTTVGTDGPS
jgi:hypothetical protein